MNSKSIMTRLSDEEVDIISRAAEIERRSRSQFIAKASLDKAQELVQNVK